MKSKKIKIYDIIIIGGGPAGLSAAIYAIRYKLNALILAKSLGGTLSLATEISNFPGQKEIKGSELAKIFIDSIKGKIDIVEDEATELSKSKNKFLVKTNNESFISDNIVLATGAERRKLDVKGEKQFERKGISYCATCDAPLFPQKTVAVVGGGNAALHSAILASKYVKKAFILVRKEMRADPILIEQALKNKKIEILKNIIIKEIVGNNFVEKVILSRKLNGKNILNLQGLFIEIGIKPNVDIAKSLKIKKDKKGFIKVDENMQTSVSGVYAAGDITTGSSGLRQVITSAAEGVIATSGIYNRDRNKK